MCDQKPVVDYVLGSALCLAVVSYIPQYISLIKSKQHKGVSELSLFILNVSGACSSANAIILNWGLFGCYKNGCNFWLCTGNLLSVWQIVIGWIMVIPLYIVFLRFKMRQSGSRWRVSKRFCVYDLAFVLSYVVFVAVILVVGLTEKEMVQDPRSFFVVFAQILGILSAVCSCVVWIPQIVKLIRTRNQGSLSLLMFIIQTPGNLVIILFQAVLYAQNWSTWFTYVVTFAEQSVILVILTLYRCGQCIVVPIDEKSNTLDSANFLDPSVEAETSIDYTTTDTETTDNETALYVEHMKSVV